jgi:hypothetical protein
MFERMNILSRPEADLSSNEYCSSDLSVKTEKFSRKHYKFWESTLASQLAQYTMEAEFFVNKITLYVNTLAYNYDYFEQFDNMMVQNIEKLFQEDFLVKTCFNNIKVNYMLILNQISQVFLTNPTYDNLLKGAEDYFRTIEHSFEKNIREMKYKQFDAIKGKERLLEQWAQSFYEGLKEYETEEVGFDQMNAFEKKIYDRYIDPCFYLNRNDKSGKFNSHRQLTNSRLLRVGRGRGGDRLQAVAAREPAEERHCEQQVQCGSHGEESQGDQGEGSPREEA